MAKRRRARMLVFLLGFYMLFVLMGGCADRLILFPSTEKTDAGGAVRRGIPFDGGEVEAWVARSPGAKTVEPQALVLNFVGNATRAEWVAVVDAVAWRERPVEVWTVNHPGYGGSSGPASLKRLPGAALAAFDALAAEAKGRPVFVAGQSLGTTMALHVAAQRKTAGLVLENPPPLRELILGRFGWWNLWLVAGPVAVGVPGELDSVRNAQRVTAPAVFVLADCDEVVPPKYQKKVVEAYAGEKRIVTNAGATHNSVLIGAAVKELEGALGWLWGKRVLSPEY